MQNLSNALSSNPIILHLSWHGSNDKKGNLIIEKEDFTDKNVTKRMIRDLLEKNGKESRIRLVVILASNSQAIGEVLINAGIDNVIWIKRDNAVQDGAWSNFSKAFYSWLFSTNSISIEGAFKIGKEAVYKSNGDIEGDKFLLLSKEDESNKWKPVLMLSTGIAVNCSSMPKIEALPDRWVKLIEI